MGGGDITFLLGILVTTTCNYNVRLSITSQYKTTISLPSPQTLYTYPENFRAFKVLVAAQYSGAKVNIDKNFVFGETNKTDAFLKKFPLGKVSETTFTCLQLWMLDLVKDK